MRLLLLLFLVGLAVAQLQPYRTQSQNVVHLTPSNFLEHAQMNLMIEFVHQSSGACHMNRQKFEEVADKLSKDVKISATLKFARILCHNEKELCDKAGVSTYPAFKFYAEGRLYHFQGGYDLENISIFITAGWQKSAGEAWSPVSSESGASSTSEGTDSPFAPALTTTATSRSSHVIKLREGNFDQSIGHSGPWIVRFYAPWCRFSKQLAPTWRQLAADLKGKVNVAEVNCDEEKDLQERFEITGYPTVELFRDGKVYHYNGNRTEEDLVDFVERRWRTLPAHSMPKKVHSRFFRFNRFHILITIGAALVALSVLGLVVLVVMKRRRDAAMAAHGQYLYSPVPLVEKGGDRI